MLFLPRNTSIDEIINRLLPLREKLTYSGEKPRTNELVLEIEELQYGGYCKGLLVSTGRLAKVYPHEVCNFFVNKYCLELSSTHS